jgi:hypothetical protein
LAAMAENAFGQIAIYKRKNLQMYDVERLHYGFYMGTAFSKFNIKYTDSFLNSPSDVVNVFSAASPRFKLGLTANYYLTKRFDVKFTPGISFGNRSIQVDQVGSSTTKTIYSRDVNLVELPVMIKFKSDRRMNSRAYFMAGINIANEANIRKTARNARADLPTKSTDLYIEYGAGYEHFLPFGKITPELRFSHGVRNLFENSTKLYDPHVKTLRSHTVSLYLFFD